MTHIVEVDQSGKIEFTGDDTVLAYANGKQFSVLIPATVKRECLLVLREQGYSGDTLYTLLFATALFFLLKDDLSNLSRIVIDIEYTGREAQIKQHLYSLLERAGYGIEQERVEFALIGKQSSAHALAITTLRRRIKADRTLTLEELLGQFGISRKVRRAKKRK